MVIWPLAIYFGAVVLVVATMLGLSYVLGQRHQEPATGERFESGITSTGSSHVRMSVSFYRVAMFFVLFDLETVFIFLWAIAGRELGWAGYEEVLTFIGILAVTLAYLWRTHALDWYPALTHSHQKEV